MKLVSISEHVGMEFFLLIWSEDSNPKLVRVYVNHFVYTTIL